MKTLRLLSIAALLALSACIKPAYEKTWDIISAGKGEWNIDELTITSIDGYSEIQEWDTTCYNAGSFKFYGTQELAKYDLDAVLPLHYSTIGPFLNYDMTCSSSDLDLKQEGVGVFKDFMVNKIIKLDRNEMILYCPSSLNTYLDIDNDVSFYFKCSKK